MRGVLRRRRSLLAYLVLVVFLLIGIYRVETLARSAHNAFCDFKADLEHRRDSTQQFLQEHPAGLVDRQGNILISRPELERSIASQTRTLRALDDLNCGRSIP